MRVLKPSRLGLEMAIAASGGWSETGGPWVTPEQAMKKAVWSDTLLRGPARFTGVLRKPPSSNGMFQDSPMPTSFELPLQTSLPGAKPAPPKPPEKSDPTYYADTKVIAVRMRDDDVRMRDRHPRVTSSASDMNLAALTDGDLRTTVTIPYSTETKGAWVLRACKWHLVVERADIGREQAQGFGLARDDPRHAAIDVADRRLERRRWKAHRQQAAQGWPVIGRDFGAGQQIGVTGPELDLAAALGGEEGALEIEEQDKVVVVGGDDLPGAAIERAVDLAPAKPNAFENAQMRPHLERRVASGRHFDIQQLALEQVGPQLEAEMAGPFMRKEAQKAEIVRWRIQPHDFRSQSQPSQTLQRFCPRVASGLGLSWQARKRSHGAGHFIGPSTVRMSHSGRPNWDVVNAITESCLVSGYSTASGDARLLTNR